MIFQPQVKSITVSHPLKILGLQATFREIKQFHRPIGTHRLDYGGALPSNITDRAVNESMMKISSICRAAKPQYHEQSQFHKST